VLKGLLPGDNVVWQVDAVEEYQALVTPTATQRWRTARGWSTSASPGTSRW